MKLSHLLHGENPTAAQLALVYGAAALGLMAGLAAGSGWLEKAVLALAAADWAGGIVANSARSTRLYYAALSPRWILAFIVLHLVEAALLAWLLGPELFFPWLWLLLATKLGVFLLGQMEHRAGPLA